MIISVVVITFNEEANIGRTLASLQPLVADANGEIIVVDSGSTDRTVEIAKSYGAKVFIEEWKGYASQKNSAIDKASGEWILSLDADEEVGPDLAAEMMTNLKYPPATHKPISSNSEGNLAPLHINGYWIPRKNYFLGRWMRYGGFWPDRKLRLFRHGTGAFKQALVHETVEVQEYNKDGISVQAKRLNAALIHHSYPTLSDYIEHMNRYSSLGAETVVAKGKRRFGLVHIVVRPLLTFFYNYFFRLGFLDGREGLLLHLYHSVYVSWKYAKAGELSRER